MHNDKFGTPVFGISDVVDIIYEYDLSVCHLVNIDDDTEVDSFNQAAEQFEIPKLHKHVSLDVSVSEFDQACQSQWFMPEKYYEIDLYQYLIDKLNEQSQDHDIQRLRITEELEEYTRRGMCNLLKYLIFLIDTMEENNIVWGVGRGSSVASYVLFLIKVHCVDSIKYQLDWREFLR